ncbi:hypothetical protein GCM10019059_34700 [Camelimonas fluminis]|uniref:Methyltransferase n=1 Tax=Camelimonas fluminis TaxID=1576911 RepID=A0ABV7UGX1_9HYPH|nr:hypothetical protein [Camelimonas fluminis]GHE72159.1 hypothetical protein GCM10019059_34700 [Camelimonas fluminis]
MKHIRPNLAVVARRTEPPESLDYFPTPPWATRAFVRHVFLPLLGAQPHDHVMEPACGEGHMAAVLSEAFDTVSASDIFPYGYGAVADFLEPDGPESDWVVTNPPFNAGVRFCRTALERTRIGCVMLVRTQWLHTDDRFFLFQDFPPHLLAYPVERIPIHKGRWEPKGSTATDYVWVCWRHGHEPRPPVWIPPGQRKALSRPDDAVRFGALQPAPLLEIMEGAQT